MSNRFEDLHVWQRAKVLYHDISLLFSDSTIYFLRDQIMRATLSISNNIAEGFERDTNKELIRFLYIAKGSCGEVRSMLHIVFDENIITKEQYDTLLDETERLSVMFKKLINTL